MEEGFYHMKPYRKENNRGFTIVELVIVIAVIAILAAVLIPTFSGIVEKANQSAAMQQAKNAWNEVSYTYVAGYAGFAADNGLLNGWYYDYIDDIAKYDIDGRYTVTYNGTDFAVTAFDAAKSRTWGAVTQASVDYLTYAVTAAPCGLNITYYTDIFSRGFAWMTNTANTASELYIVESNLGIEADFNVTPISGSYQELNNANAHKAHVTGLKSSTTYSYKVGGNGHWVYGVFRTDTSNPTTITAIQLSDAQTKNKDLLNVWENTMAQAVETAGHSLDFILFNGDQADGSGEIFNFDVRYGIAKETVSEYVNSLPYMTSSGNHEANISTNVQNYNCAIEYGDDSTVGDGITSAGCYYSYDYNFAHFVVLDSNVQKYTTKQLNDELTWLRNDLDAANNNDDIKWIIVMMHNGPYATGDHSNDSTTQKIVKNFTPIFSQYHVDLVLQAHDHTYNKTLPYKWDADGYTITYNNANVVNLTPATTVYNDKVYDLNPNGTYYVTTGAAGHRAGEGEADAGLWADVVMSGDTINGATEVSYRKNQYKIEVGTINQNNEYNSYSFSGKASGTSTNVSYTNDGTYEVGDPATGNVNAQMFGVLNLTETTLTYDFYTVQGNDVKLFDTLNVLKK